MKHAGDAYERVESLLRELTEGVVFTGSRMGCHLSEESWDHREWAGQVLHLLAGEVGEDDLIPLDGTELAKPYARKMQYPCAVEDASRPGDPFTNGYWCWGAYHWGVERPTLNPLMLRPYAPGLVGPGGRVMPAGQWAQWALANRPARGNAVTLEVSLPPGDVPQFGTSASCGARSRDWVSGSNGRCCTRSRTPCCRSTAWPAACTPWRSGTARPS